ncbi:MAG TPA: TonB-dependent receptor [Bryobacteraceae bacterium]|nr:TonB-dependent receptor [Bryobacteraceae bacterium]
MAGGSLAAEPHGSVTGQVYDPVGRILVGASVRLESQGESPEKLTRTDEQGRFQLAELPPGTYSITASSDGLLPQTQHLTLSSGESRSLNLHLPLGTLSQQVTVTATRTAEAIVAIPGSVTVIGADQVQDVSAGTGLNDSLGKLVPGLALSSQSTSTFSQTLRGRNYSVLIDGIPQATSRNVSHDLTTIDPSAIERIEVIRGATAIYGDRAAGGVLNIFTKRYEDGTPHFTTDIGVDASIPHPSGSLGTIVRQKIGGRHDRWDYLFNGSFTGTGGFFDADGNRIPPDPHGQGGLADTRTYNALGKAGYRFGHQSLVGTLNRFDSSQHTEWTTDPAVNALPPGSVTSRAISGLDQDLPQGSTNTLVSLDYTHTRLLGSRVHGQFYWKDYFTRFAPYDGRTQALIGRQVIQSRLESAKYGGRVEMETRALDERATLLWGLDYSSEDTSQPVDIMDPLAYAASGGRRFSRIGERIWVPPVDQHNLGVFAQLEWQAAKRWILRAGVRHERIQARIDDFTTLADARITGGTRNYAGTVFNAGAVYTLTGATSLFGSFSQGFSAPDLGLVLRGAPEGSFVNSLPYAAQRVNSYETGWRGMWRPVQTSVAVFYSTSDLGTSSGGFNQPVVRAPERVYGAEASVDGTLSPRWRAGLQGTWLEGKSDPAFNGRYRYLNSYRIPPLKLTSYVDHQMTARWRNRLQLVFSGSRRRFGIGSTVFGELPVTSFATLDWASTVELGRGRLRFSVENMLNRFYYPTDSQLIRSGRNDSHSAARGAALTVGYTVSY